MIDVYEKMYRTLPHSHYGAWPSIEEVEKLNALEHENCRCVVLSTGRGNGKTKMCNELLNEIKEEMKMKNKAIICTVNPELIGPGGIYCDFDELKASFNGKLNSGNDITLNFAKPRVATTYHPDRIIPEIKDVIFNGPATIVLWKDGTKTVVKAQEGEIIDYEKGMAMAIAKRMLGNKGSYYDAFTKYLPKEEEPTEEA